MRIALPLVAALSLVTPARADPNYWIDQGRSEVTIFASNDGPRYLCTFRWTVTFEDGTSIDDGCRADVDRGAQNLPACTKTYAQPVQRAELTSGHCNPR